MLHVSELCLCWVHSSHDIRFIQLPREFFYVLKLKVRTSASVECVEIALYRAWLMRNEHCILVSRADVAVIHNNPVSAAINLWVCNISLDYKSLIFKLLCKMQVSG